MNFNLALSFLAAVSAVNGLEESSLRGNGTPIGEIFSNRAPNRDLKVSTYEGFDESLPNGVCKGALCGTWGDPHVITCDGLKFDCMAAGLFTLMDNHMFEAQAAFVEVSHAEEKDLHNWGLPTATLLNDVVINYKTNDAVPKIQLGFGKLVYPKENGNMVPAEDGCETGYSYVWETKKKLRYELDMKGGGTKRYATLQECREICEKKKNDKKYKCEAFQWFADGSCYMIDSKMEKRENPRHWARVLSGSLDSDCGKEVLPMLESKDQIEKHGEIGDIEKCPLLMYLDNELVDISNKTNSAGEGYLWGGEGDKNYVWQSGKVVTIVTEASEGGSAEIQLKLTGNGPGNKWSCMFDFDVCLPETEQDDFEKSSTGLLGSPNGNRTDDWKDVDGNVLVIRDKNTATTSKHDTMTEYCENNWCVSQADSMMTYHGDMDYSHYKCHNEPHIPFDPDADSCLYGKENAILHCQGFGSAVEGCIFDCCNGYCPKDVPDIVRYNDEPVDDKPVFPEIEGCSPETVLDDNSNSVCPNAADPVVKLLKQTGVQDIPEGADIFYDIAFGSSPAGNSAVVNTVTFKVNNPFDVKADVYVKHDKQALSTFVEPTCNFQPDSHGCDANTDDITVVCHKYDGIAAFALVQIYFVSIGVDDGVNGEGEENGEQGIVDKCCNADPMIQPNTGIVEYTFEVMCGCPDIVG